MSDILLLKTNNCKNCYKCIRSCPTKSIRFSDGHAHVIADDCVLCGKCYVVCPQSAKEIRGDLDTVREMLKSHEVYVSVAPSFAAAYPGLSFDSLKAALTSLGFADAEETAIGATFVKREYERILRDNPDKPLISSCCPSVNLLIRKYYPNALPYLSEVMTPLEAHATDIKRRHPNAEVVFVGPCIAKKDEADESDLIDAVLGFDELDAWLKSANVALNATPEIGDGRRSRLFPITGGIVGSMDLDPSIEYFAVDGIERCMTLLAEVESGDLTNCFIEMSACEGGCVGGPVMLKSAKSSPTRSYVSVKKFAALGKSTEADADFDITHVRAAIDRPSTSVAEDEIAAILRKMGKNSPADELNCGSCGYNTCRDKAIAVALGKAEVSMCLPYMMAREESVSEAVVQNSPNAIVVLNDALEVLKINPAAIELLGFKSEADLLAASDLGILDTDAIDRTKNRGKIITNERSRLKSSGRVVDRSVAYNAESHLFICIMHDVTAEIEATEKKLELRSQAAAIADDMAKKQLKIVQDIASLLGETASDTLIAIEHLKETISDD